MHWLCDEPGFPALSFHRLAHYIEPKEDNPGVFGYASLTHSDVQDS